MRPTPRTARFWRLLPASDFVLTPLPNLIEQFTTILEKGEEKNNRIRFGDPVSEADPVIFLFVVKFFSAWRTKLDLLF